MKGDGWQNTITLVALPILKAQVFATPPRRPILFSLLFKVVSGEISTSPPPVVCVNLKLLCWMLDFFHIFVFVLTKAFMCIEICLLYIPQVSFNSPLGEYQYSCGNFGNEKLKLTPINLTVHHHHHHHHTPPSIITGPFPHSPPRPPATHTPGLPPGRRTDL